jgi:TolA-binding protein
MRIRATILFLLAAAACAVAQSDGPRSSQPLPSLRLGVSIGSGLEMDPGSLPEAPAERDVSPATARAIAELLRAAGSDPRPILKVQVLTGKATDGDQVLQGVATGTLAAGDWAGAERKLKDYLSRGRTHELAAAARFYLGQAYWFLGRPRDAFFEFLLCEDDLPREARAWQDACLTELAAGH